jgi:hypothetical protein
MYCVVTFQRPDAVEVMTDYLTAEVFGPFETADHADAWIRMMERGWKCKRFLIREVRVPHRDGEAAAESGEAAEGRIVELKGTARLRQTFRDQFPSDPF